MRNTIFICYSIKTKLEVYLCMFLPSAHTTEQILINPSLNGPIKKNNQIGKSFFFK